MRCDACGNNVGDDARFCPTCGATIATPVSPPSPPPATAPPPAAAPPTAAAETEEFREQLAQRWQRTQASPVRVGIVAALGAFAVLLVVSAVLALGLVKLLEGQIQSGSEEEFVRGLLGSLVVFVTKYFVYAFNWLPVHVELFGGLGGSGIGAREGATVHAAIVAGLPAVGFLLHRAGRWAVRNTTPTLDEDAAVRQGAVIGAGYAVLLVLFATAAAGNLSLRVSIFEGRAALGPNRLFALVVASLVGAFFACWGTLSASGARPWEVLVRRAGAWLDWLVGLVAAVAAWATGLVVASALGVVWLVQELVTDPSVVVDESGEGLSWLAAVVGAVVYGLNLAAMLLLQGMGLPLREVEGGTSEAVELGPVLQLGSTVVAVGMLVLAGYLAQRVVRRRYDTVRVVTRVALGFAVVTTVLSRVALIRFHGAGETTGTTASIVWVFLISLVEAGALGMVGAQLALRSSLPVDRLWGLRWFSGPVLAPAGGVGVGAEAEEDGLGAGAGAGAEEPPARPRALSRTVLAVLAAVVVVPLLLVTVAPAVVGRESPADAVRRYLAHLDKGNAGAVADDVRLPEDGGALLTAEAMAAMVRQNPRRIEEVEIVETDSTGDTTVVEATFRENGTTVRRTFEVAKGEGKRWFGLWPTWEVVPPTTAISIDVPAGGGGVTVDGLEVPGARRRGEEVTVDVFEGPHRVALKASGLLDAAATRIDTARGRRVVLQARLSERGRRAVRDAVKGYFDGCVKSTEVRPDGCPQSVFPRGSEQQNVAWSLQGDPVEGMEAELRSDGVVLVTGSYSMSVTYDWTSPGFFGPPETGRETEEDEGSYYLRFALDGDRLRLVSANSLF